ncbi:unnamed protein product [Closterium sp. NIES-54]
MLLFPTPLGPCTTTILRGSPFPDTRTPTSSAGPPSSFPHPISPSATPPPPATALRTTSRAAGRDIQFHAAPSAHGDPSARAGASACGDPSARGDPSATADPSAHADSFTGVAEAVLAEAERARTTRFLRNGDDWLSLDSCECIRSID